MALPQVDWVDYACRAEFIRPIIIGDKEVTLSYDALRRGRYSLHNQVYCITTVTRDRQPVFTNLNAARLLVHELRTGIVPSMDGIVAKLPSDMPVVVVEIGDTG